MCIEKWYKSILSWFIVDRGGMFCFCCGCIKLSAFYCAGITGLFFVGIKYIYPTTLSSTYLLTFLCQSACMLDMHAFVCYTIVYV